jgi:hypothetical protein
VHVPAARLLFFRVGCWVVSVRYPPRIPVLHVNSDPKPKTVQSTLGFITSEAEHITVWFLLKIICFWPSVLFLLNQNLKDKRISSLVVKTVLKSQRKPVCSVSSAFFEILYICKSKHLFLPPSNIYSLLPMIQLLTQIIPIFTHCFALFSFDLVTSEISLCQSLKHFLLLQTASGHTLYIFTWTTSLLMDI